MNRRSVLAFLGLGPVAGPQFLKSASNQSMPTTVPNTQFADLPCENHNPYETDHHDAAWEIVNHRTRHAEYYFHQAPFDHRKSWANHFKSRAFIEDRDARHEKKKELVNHLVEAGKNTLLAEAKRIGLPRSVIDTITRLF